MAEEPSLELLQRMVQKVLDGQGLVREELKALRRRVAGVEHALVGLQESNVTVQDQLDMMNDRLTKLEAH